MHTYDLSFRQDATSRHVAVVDPRPQDYADLLEHFAAAGINGHFLRLGRDALRLARVHDADLWIVHFTLPDMPGSDVCKMLKECRPESAVYMVSDEYSEAEERAARISGAAMFACKPASTAWLERMREKGEKGDKSNYSWSVLSESVLIPFFSLRN